MEKRHNIEKHFKLAEFFDAIPAESRTIKYTQGHDSMPSLSVRLENIPLNIDFNALSEYLIGILQDLKDPEKI